MLDSRSDLRDNADMLADKLIMDDKFQIPAGIPLLFVGFSEPVGIYF